MPSLKPLGEYKVVSDKVRAVLGRRIDIDDPFFGATSLAPFRKTVSLGRELLPARYHEPYLNVLQSALDQAEVTIKERNANASRAVFEQLNRVFSTLAMPIVQLNENNLPLKAYLAVVSNFYRRFLEDDKVANKLKQSGYIANLDPLGFFVDSKDEPYTIAPTVDLPLAFIAKPVQYADFAPLFIVEGHEVGGHVLLAKISGFADEVKDSVVKVLRKHLRDSGLPSGVSRVKLPRKPLFFQRGYKQVSVSTFLSEAFGKWSQELFCDACGVLNLGPAYVNGLILVLSQRVKPRKVSSRSSFSLVNGVSTHPFDVLRVMFCLEVLKLLDFDNKQAYLDALNIRFMEACGGRLPENLTWLNAVDEEVFSLLRQDFQALAELAAKVIVNQSMNSLDARSMKELMTWGSRDEDTVSGLKKELQTGVFDGEEPVEARHIVAASMLAIEEASVLGADQFSAHSTVVNENALRLLAQLYSEQCLLCDAPAHWKTRRQDIFALSKLASYVEITTRL